MEHLINNKKKEAKRKDDIHTTAQKVHDELLVSRLKIMKNQKLKKCAVKKEHKKNNLIIQQTKFMFTRKKMDGKF